MNVNQPVKLDRRTTDGLSLYLRNVLTDWAMDRDITVIDTITVTQRQ